MRLLVIGGSDAGISAALRARELNPSAEVTVVLADAYPNYSICGLPFYVSGETPDWQSLAHRTEFPGITLVTKHTAHTIDSKQKTVLATDSEDRAVMLPYDRLVIATGAGPVRPAIPGLDLPGVFTLHTMTMEDSFHVKEYVAGRQPRTSVVVGTGYLGLEMADALTQRGLLVTLVGRSPAPLQTVDEELGRLIEQELLRHGVEVCNQVDVSAIQADGNGLVVSGTRGFAKTSEMVLVAAGVRPETELAQSAGITTGLREAIQVSRRMETNLTDVYAAGDCVETWHRLLGRYTYLPLGTTAHKQGRIAGENAIGGDREFAGSLGTQVVKVFDLAIARTGVRENEARQAGFDARTTQTTVSDHTPYYPDPRELCIRTTGDRASGRLLGAQMLGHWRGAVTKRIDVFAAALFHNMRVEELNKGCGHRRFINDRRLYNSTTDHFGSF